MHYTLLETRPETPRAAKIARRCELCRWKAAVVVFLLQGLTAAQIVPHSRFAAVMGFGAGPLVEDEPELNAERPVEGHRLVAAYASQDGADPRLGDRTNLVRDQAGRPFDAALWRRDEGFIWPEIPIGEPGHRDDLDNGVVAARGVVRNDHRQPCFLDLASFRGVEPHAYDCSPFEDIGHSETASSAGVPPVYGPVLTTAGQAPILGARKKS
jgi:hypothetical protein